MAEDIVLGKFTADFTELKKKLDGYVDNLQVVQKEEKKTGKEAEKAAETAESAAKKRNAAIKIEQAELKRLVLERKKAFDPKVIEDYNTKITESTKRISTLSGKTASFGASAKSIFANVGAGIVAAFSIQAVAAFAKASIDSFLDAEKTANKLKFAVTQIGGESEVVFNRLIDQSAKLQKTTIFSDDSIQAAQAALAAFGLTGKEIENLLPKLADFASLSEVDITQAAERVGAALEGSGKEFKNYGIIVSATATRQENLNSILGGLPKFAGSAEEATKTLAGRLLQADNRADDLQEQIGSFLAPSFVVMREAALSAISALIGFDNVKFEIDTRRLDSAKDRVDRFVKVFEKGGANVDLGITTKINQLSIAFDNAKIEAERLQKLLDNNYSRAANGEWISLLLARQNELKLTLGAQIDEFFRYQELLRANVKAEADAAAAVTARILTIDQARKKSNEELIALSESEKEINDKTSKNNIKLIESVIAARKKEVEELEKNLALLSKLQIDNIEDLKQQRIAQFEAETKALTARGQLRAEIIKQLEIRLVADLNAIDLKRDVDPLFRVPIRTITTPDVLTSTRDTDTSDITQAQQDAIDDSKTTNEKIVAAAENLVNEISQLYSTLAQNQINSITEATNAQLSSIDLLLKANEEALSKRRISETEAALREKELLALKVKAEQDADKKIREIKRKQAIADKAAALISIAIDTARNIVAAGNPILAALYAVLGATQAAIVAAQPIPYERGTKSAQGGLSRVDEAGEELVVRQGRGRLTTLERGDKVIPAPQTRKYSAIFDAMVDNKLDDYILKNFVTPQLEHQRREFMDIKDKSFANNITRSIMIQQASGGKGDFFLEKMSKGISLTNAQEIGRAIASELSVDPYRR